MTVEADDPSLPTKASPEDAAPLVGVSMDSVPPSFIMLMRQTRPWVLLSILLMVVAFDAPLVFYSFKDIFTPHASETPRQQGLLGLALIPAPLFLWRYERAIRRFLRARTQGALEEALLSQKSFWKFLGIVTIVILTILSLSLVRGAFR
jgi:hypothetical protein